MVYKKGLTQPTSSFVGGESWDCLSDFNHFSIFTHKFYIT